MNNNVPSNSYVRIMKARWNVEPDQINDYEKKVAPAIVAAREKIEERLGHIKNTSNGDDQYFRQSLVKTRGSEVRKAFLSVPICVKASTLKPFLISTLREELSAITGIPADDLKVTITHSSAQK